MLPRPFPKPSIPALRAPAPLTPHRPRSQLGPRCPQLLSRREFDIAAQTPVRPAISPRNRAVGRATPSAKRRRGLVHALASCASHQAIHSASPSTVTWCSCVPSRWLLELHHGHLRSDSGAWRADCALAKIARRNGALAARNPAMSSPKRTASARLRSPYSFATASCARK
jgi:hypothetical protein